MGMLITWYVIATLNLARSSRIYSNKLLAVESAYTRMMFHILQYDFIISNYADVIEIVVSSF